ncbi:MAG: helix-turn-helix transcriptional regulator [Candidatus Woesearchaeota archaeon]
MKFHEYDAFCDTYGRTLNNLVWGHFLTNANGGTAVGDMAKEIGISRPKAYQIVEEFLKKGYIKKSRVFGKTQIYALNEENPVVKIFQRNFKECLNIVAGQYSKKKTTSSTSTRIAVSAKGI